MHNRIKELRQDAGLTQEQLAALVETSAQQIARLEKSQRRLSQGWMTRLGRALGVRPTALMEDGPIGLLKTNGIRNAPNEVDEEELLVLWREMDFDTKVALMELARFIATRLGSRAA